MSGTLAVTGDPVADELVNTNPLALLLAMLLDQQIPMEWAFRGPATLQKRLGELDPASIAAMDPEMLTAVCCEKPAIHRFPTSMSKRIQALCQKIVEDYDGDASTIWSEDHTANEIIERLHSLPGYGSEKSMILLAILAKRFDLCPEGWAKHAGPFADNTPRSVADIDGPEALANVRAWKKSQKIKGKTKQE